MIDIVHESKMDEVNKFKMLLEITHNLNLKGMSKYMHKASNEALYGV
jgi:hypothetical protein